MLIYQVHWELTILKDAQNGAPAMEYILFTHVILYENSTKTRYIIA